MTIQYRSTNRKAPLVSFKDALLKGQAPDYGLYMPTELPSFTKEEITSFKKMEYRQIAYHVAKKFLKDEILDSDLKKVCDEAYNFDVPLEKVHEKLYIMRLDRGPTYSFKDFAARMMARLMQYFAQQENRNLHVLVATSGDTGGAVADAFYGLNNVKVTVLFPEKEVTERQRRQMTTLGDNITAIAVKGKFDDCQALVKRAFNDPELAEYNLTSANSINFGRLLPQIVYYVYAYSRMGNKLFAVPSGNFGNLMGGVLAKRMGLPVDKFIVAVNENDEFPKFLKTGSYTPVVPSRECSSNAMNVGHPSNLARLIDLYGGWLTDERDAKGSVIRKGVLKQKPNMDAMNGDFVSFAITDEEVDKTIKKIFDKYGIIVEPHGAVALAAAEKADLEELTVALETADPAKFPEKINEILGIDPKVPVKILEQAKKKESFAIINNDYEEFKKKIIN